MPRYLIERRYLLPVYQHLAIEAPDLATACDRALFDTGLDADAARAEGHESPRPFSIEDAVEITDDEEWRVAVNAPGERRRLLLHGGHDHLDIPDDFTLP